MRLSRCPKCGAKVAQTDTVCLDCGADLVAAREDIVERAKREARTSAQPKSPAAAVANPAAAGIAVPGETAEEKRLRIFDQQQADVLRKQRPAMIVILLLAIIGAVGMWLLASNYLKQAGGWAEIKKLNFAAFKAAGLNVFSDPRIMFVIFAGLALACLLGVLGEILRLWSISAAIAAVKRGEIPNVVQLSAFTEIGLVLGAFLAPPAGLILGLIFKFSKDEDTRAIGSVMIYAALLCAAFLIFNLLWNLAAAHMPAPKAPAPGTDEIDKEAMLLRLLA